MENIISNKEKEITPPVFEELGDAQKMTYLLKIKLIPESDRSIYQKIIYSRYLKGNYNFKLDSQPKD